MSKPEPFFHDSFQEAVPEPPELDPIWTKLHYFQPKEFNFPSEMSPELLHRLDATRFIAGIPFIVTSDFQPGDSLAHGKGLAVDIRAHDSWARFAIVEAAIKMGFDRIGTYTKHVHLDVDVDLPPGLWVGTSE